MDANFKSVNQILYWEIAGVIFIIVFGAIFHFLFEWTGYSRPVALVAAVNESIWEHLKMAFWPGLLFALIEYRYLKYTSNNFWLAKTTSLLTIPALIITCFYGYTALLGQNYLVLDILTFILAVVAGQFVSYKLLTAEGFGRVLQAYALAIMGLLVMAFSLLTYYPPHIFLFEDPRDHEYGILNRHVD